MLKDFGEIDYLCFSGGGGYGMMFIGALEALKRTRNLDMDRIKGCIGTSAGALTAFFVATGASYERFLALALEYDHCNIAPKMDIALLVNHYGMDEGGKLMEVIENVIESAGMSKNVTFSDLFRLTKRHFISVASNLDTEQAVYLDHVSNPNMEVKLAIRASMGLPLVYPPCVIGETFYVDGALTEQYPVDFFPLEKTLVLGVNIPKIKVAAWREYAIAVMSCGITSQKNKFVKRLHAMNLISHFIDLPAPPFDLKLTEIRKDVASFGFYHMLLVLCPEISIALHTIVLYTIMSYLKLFQNLDETQTCGTYSECELRLLESDQKGHNETSPS